MSGASSVTATVISFVRGAQLDDFPAEALDLGKRCIIDGLGVVLAGSTQAASGIVRRYVLDGAAPGESTALGPEAFKTTAPQAALVNGTSGHALDWDDTQLATSPDRIFGLLTHPTIPPLVAALAVGERQRAPGVALLEAFLTGFEVECKIAEAIDPSHYEKGFHSSGTAGTFGAAVAAAKLLGLDDDALAHALAIAASSASGIRVNFGSMTKPLHVGRAAENGVVAAELAARGFTGSRDALDPPWGFLQTFSHGDGFDAERIVGKLGEPHTIVWPGVSIKPYPCGVLGHPTMDAMRRLVIEHDLDASQIAAIRVRAGSNILNPLRYGTAHNELEAKFSLPFMLSAIALRRKAGIHEFNDDFVTSGAVQALMRKVERVLDPEIEALGWDKIRSTVEVDVADGRTLIEPADERYRGGPDLPFTRDELHDKFSECAALLLPEDVIDEVFATVELLEDLSDVGALARLLSTTSGRFA
jgi:2-methylcitrate dehydratase PrpD